MSDEPRKEREHRGGFDFDLEIPGELVVVIVLAVCATVVGVVYLITTGGGC